MRTSKPARSQRFTESGAVLSLDERGGLRVAIVADTHSRPHPRAAERIAALAPDAILHAGDIGDRNVLDALGEIAPVIAVRGNIDARLPDLPDAITIDVRAGEASGLRVLLTHIAVYGPKIRADVAQRANASGATLVVCGHSHVPFIGRDKGLTVFNPGSIGPRRMHLPIVFGALEIEDHRLRLRHIDCETGHAWAP
jgi:uncharacterized protein